jgi:hypothetical protein
MFTFFGTHWIVCLAKRMTIAYESWLYDGRNLEEARRAGW